MNRHEHWETVYRTKESGAVSWFEAEPAMSLRLLDEAGWTPASCVLDVGGGDSRLVDALLQRGATCVTVLDIAGAALDRARARLGPAADAVSWIQADVTGDWTAPAVDIWHDRAVFHFLTDPADRRAYRAHLASAVKPDGAVIIATFAPDGPEKCSGLPVARYAPDTLAAELGDAFTLVGARRHVHETPWQATQPFQYSVFRRRSKGEVLF